jgi:SpoVK/Ycf46/Vps4 family AAA+-type ATPase
MDILDYDFEGCISTRELIEKIRKEYSISDSLKCYWLSDYNIFERLEFYGRKFDTNYIKTFLINNKIVDVDGVYRTKDFTLVIVGFLDSSSECFLFTKNFKKAAKELLKQQGAPLLRNGIYRIEVGPAGAVLTKIKLGNITKPILNDNLFENMMLEIRQFGKKEKTYRDNQSDYKRGFLLYGLPGNGKTCFIRYLLSRMEAIAIVCDTAKEYEIESITKILQNKELNDKLKIIVLEDIDRVAEYNRSTFLNLIDGLMALNKVIFIATTNFPYKLDIGIKNRPGRFDTFYEIGNPNEKSRETLLKNFFKKIDSGTLKEAIKQTEGFRGCHFRELFFISSFYECDVLTAIKKMKKKFENFSKFGEEKFPEVG